jgi:aspartate kinase
MPIAELRHKYFLSNPSPPPKLSFAKKPKMSAVSHNGPVMIQNHLKKNNSALKLVVQKYGGTSIGKFPVQIADIVRYTEVTASLRPILLLNTTHRESLTNNKVAVVCSARSTGKKSEGTTSR